MSCGGLGEHSEEAVGAGIPRRPKPNRGRDHAPMTSTDEGRVQPFESAIRRKNQEGCRVAKGQALHS